MRPSGVDQIAAMRMFVRVVESGSFSAVARTTGVGQPAVGKQITSLEAHIGAQLLRRSSRSLGLTEAAQDLYGSAVRLIGDLDAAEPRGRRRQSAPSGLVRVTMAPVFGARMSLKGAARVWGFKGKFGEFEYRPQGRSGPMMRTRSVRQC